VTPEVLFLQVKNGIVEKTLIKKGLSNSKYFEVLSNEVNENTQVIIEGKAMVKDGIKVKISK